MAVNVLQFGAKVGEIWGFSSSFILAAV